MAKCVCVCANEDGTFSAHVEEYDGGAEGQTFQSAEELMASLPALLQEAQSMTGEEDAPMMEGEQETRAMAAGFKDVRGGGMGY